MPLEKGSSQRVISRNIEEMQEHGHPHRQAVAAALHTAKDHEECEDTKREKSGYYDEENWRGVKGAHKPVGGLSGTSKGTHFPPELHKAKIEKQNEKMPEPMRKIMNKDDTMGGLKREAEELPSSDAAYAPATAMTIEDIQREGERMWAGPDGNIGSKVGAASSLPQSTQAQTAVFPQGDAWSEEAVKQARSTPHSTEGMQTQGPLTKSQQEYANKASYNKPKLANFGRRAAIAHHPENDSKDEVSPTQSDPPDDRSDNLMTPESEGIADETSYNSRMYNQHPEAFAGHDRVELGEYAQAAKKTRAGHATGFSSDKVDLVEWAREEEEEKGHEK